MCTNWYSAACGLLGPQSVRGEQHPQHVFRLFRKRRIINIGQHNRLVGRATQRHIVPDGPQRIQVAALVNASVRVAHFRRRVLRAHQRLPGYRDGAAHAGHAGEVEVAELDRSIVGEVHAVGREVAVQHLFAVAGFKGVSQCIQDAQLLIKWDGWFVIVQPLMQRLSLDPLQQQPVDVVSVGIGQEVVGAHDVRTARQHIQHADVTREPLHRLLQFFLGSILGGPIALHPGAPVLQQHMLRLASVEAISRLQVAQQTITPDNLALRIDPPLDEQVSDALDL